MKLDEEMSNRAFGAEHLVDQNNAPEVVENECMICGGTGRMVMDIACHSCHGTGKAEVVKETEEQADPVLNAIDKAKWTSSNPLGIDDNGYDDGVFDHNLAIDRIRTAYLASKGGDEC